MQRLPRVHLAYLERDGVEKDGAPGRLYGPEGALAREAFGEPVAGEQRQFRFIVSPEDGDRLDLTTFARQFMARLPLGRQSRLRRSECGWHRGASAGTTQAES
jgi:type IV secretory pathway VirD2 relaxase